jgi:hypothetical protein
LTIQVAFGAPTGAMAICSRPDASVSLEPPIEDYRQALVDAATRIRARLEARTGNVDDGDLVGQDGSGDASQALDFIRALGDLLREGALGAALAGGWSSLVCDEPSSSPSIAGGRTGGARKP